MWWKNVNFKNPKIGPTWARNRCEGDGLWLWLLALVTCETWNLIQDTWHMTHDVKKLTGDSRQMNQHMFLVPTFVWFIGATLCTGQEIQCLWYEVFFSLLIDEFGCRRVAWDHYFWYCLFLLPHYNNLIVIKYKLCCLFCIFIDNQQR